MFRSQPLIVQFLYLGVALLLLTPLVIASPLFFPFITGKNFYFRIITELVFALWAVTALFYPEFRPKRSPILIAVMAFIGIVAIATLNGVDPYRSFWSNFERMEGLVTHFHLLALFFVLGHTFRTKESWRSMLGISLFVSVVAAFHAFLQHIGILTMVSEARPYAMFGNSIYLSVYLMFHLFLSLFFWQWAKTPAWRSVVAIIAAFEFYVFFVTASRGAFLGFLGGMLFIASVALFSRSGRKFRIAAVGAFLVAAIFLGLVAVFPKSVVVQKSELLSRLSSVSIHRIGDDPRILIWGIAWDAFRERPILGWGPENFIYPYAKFYNPNLFGNEAWFDRAHNMLLEWLVAAGALGFLGFFAMLGSAGYMLRRLFREQKIDWLTAVVLGGLLVAYVIQDVFVFDNITTYLVIYFVFAFLHYRWIGDTRPVPVFVARPVFYTVSATVAVGMVFVIYGLNARPIFAAREIISGLQAFQQSERSGILPIKNTFTTIESYHTFGTTEARERLADMLIQVAERIEGTSPVFVDLLNYTTSEFEKEVVKRPNNPRTMLFLGKLHTIRQATTGEGRDRAEVVYRQALILAPRYIQLRLALAELYLLTGATDRAVEETNIALALPSKQETLNTLFFSALSVKILAGDFDGATLFVDETYARVGALPELSGSVVDTNFVLLVKRIFSAPGEPRFKLSFLKDLEKKIPHPYINLALAQTYGDLGQYGEARAHAVKAAAGDAKLRPQVEEFIRSIDELP